MDSFQLSGMLLDGTVPELIWLRKTLVCNFGSLKGSCHPKVTGFEQQPAREAGYK